jgi:hypothetical protein
MTVLGTRAGQQSARVLNAPERRCDGQINARTPAKQSGGGFELAMRAGHPAVGICSVVAQQIDQRYLDSAFARYASRANQVECLI